MQVLFDDAKRAVGVEFTRNNTVHTARASREIILSAGAVDTPKLLMLSGIGDADHLKTHNVLSIFPKFRKGAHYLQIAVVVNSSHVGRNLKDHVLTMLHYDVEPEYVLHSNEFFTHWGTIKSALEYAVFGTGAT